MKIHEYIVGARKIHSICECNQQKVNKKVFVTNSINGHVALNMAMSILRVYATCILQCAANLLNSVRPGLVLKNYLLAATN
ncbi:hypothetical protein P8452_39220 [Trifolium repens]|nr:hypothetical protein P8452_39220 [Trifolium repens]